MANAAVSVIMSHNIQRFVKDTSGVSAKYGGRPTLSEKRRSEMHHVLNPHLPHGGGTERAGLPYYSVAQLFVGGLGGEDVWAHSLIILR